MQRRDGRSTNRDKPTHPSIPSSAGITVSRICAISASMDEDCARMWYFVRTLSASVCVGAASRRRRRPLHRPPAAGGVAMSGRVSARRQFGFAEIQCAPEYYVVHKHVTNEFCAPAVGARCLRTHARGIRARPLPGTPW